MAKVKKIKVWSVANADRKIREYIFARDNYKCVFCGRGKPYVILDPSHFWGRYVKRTRWLPENLDTVCRGDHYKIEHAKQGFYREWKIKQLGEKKYKELEKEYYQGKKNQREAILQLMQFLKVK